MSTAPGSPPSDDLAARLAALQAILALARDEVRAIADDPWLGRALDVFRRIPAGDRDILLGVLEREVGMRRHTGAMDQAAGMTLHPNPNARLYVRAMDPALRHTTLEADDWVLLALQGIRVFQSVFEPEFFPMWKAAIAKALTLADPDEVDRYERAIRVIGELCAAHRAATAIKPTGTG